MEITALKYKCEFFKIIKIIDTHIGQPFWLFKKKHVNLALLKVPF